MTLTLTDYLMAQAKKSMKDEPPLEKKTITKGHEIVKDTCKRR